MKFKHELTRIWHFVVFIKGKIYKAKSLVLKLIFVVFTLPQIAYASSQYSVVTILHTNDIHGIVLPSNNIGGLARIASVIDKTRETMPNVLLFDAGDFMHGTHEEYITKGESVVTSMNLLNYTAAAVGNHEFDYHSETFRNTALKANFPLLSANIKNIDGSEWTPIKPYIITEIDGIKIAIFALTTLETLDYQWPASISDIKFLNPFETAKSLVPNLKEQADVIICISHLGVEVDKKLARTVDGIDFIIGSHSHTVLSKHHFENKTLIAQAGAYGAFLGRIDFIYKKSETRNEIVSINNHKVSWNSLRNVPYNVNYPELALIPITDTIEPNAEIYGNYQEYRNISDEYLGQTVSFIEEDIKSDELLADALKFVSDSSAEIVSKWSLKNRQLEKGEILKKQIYDLIVGYTRQDIVVGNIKFSDIKKFVKNDPTKKYSLFHSNSDDNEYIKLSAQAFVMMDIMKKYKVENPQLAGYTTREALLKYFDNIKTSNQ